MTGRAARYARATSFRAFAIAALITFTVNAASESIDAGLPLQPARTLAFSTHQGTWMSVDVAPDARTLIFDHLGDLYVLPVSGGKARRILGGMAFETQPRVSPDGSHIVFVSDRSGRSAIWTATREGRDLRQLSPNASSGTREFTSPIWTPDGSAVIGMYVDPPEGGTRITRFPLAKGAAPEDLVIPQREKGQNYYVDPSITPDGRFLYLARRVFIGSDERGGSPWDTTGRYVLARLDLLTREIKTYLPRVGGAFAPQVTHSGGALIFATRDFRANQTVLRMFDLISSTEHALTSPVQLDMQENTYPGSLPGYSLTRDDRTLFVAHDGKLWRVAVDSGRQSEIPFQVDVNLELGPLAHFDYPLDDAWVDVRAPMSAHLSPDGETVAFASVGAIWLASTRSGEIHRLTPETHRAMEPAWSPDGVWIAYTTWDPSTGTGAIFRIRADGTGGTQPITTQSHHYEDLLFAPDGRAVIVRLSHWPRVTRNAMHTELWPLDQTEEQHPVQQIGLDGQVQRTIVTIGGDGMGYDVPAEVFEEMGGLHLAGADPRLYFREHTTLSSIKLDGTDRHVETVSQYAVTPSDVRVSPRGNRALLTTAKGVNLVQVIRPSGASGTVFTNELALPAMNNFNWSVDGRSFHGFLDMRFLRYDLVGFESDPDGYKPYEIQLSLRVPAAKPSGTVALRGGRIITMRGDEIIEHGDVVIENNRIVAVGPSGSVAIPSGAAIVDVAGRTVMPGWVDIHAHDLNSWGDRTRARHMAELSYGVTAVRDPSPMLWPLPTFDDIKAGLDLGPRTFSTGRALRNLEDASASELRALIEGYANGMHTETLKQYRSGGRAIRQNIVMLAHEFRLTPTNEALESFWGNLTMIIDGYGGVEHTPGVTPYYDDVIQLVARSGTVWTPTLAAGGPDYWPDDYAGYLLSQLDLNHESRYQRFILPEDQDENPRGSYRVRSPERYLSPRAAADAAHIIAAGGRVGLGSHGLAAIGAQLELWALSSGGMPLHDVLKAGTIFSAEAIGHGADFGSLEVGKLADLQVLDRNPLEDIHNTKSVSLVMANGFLYETGTLNRIWPDHRALPKQWWQ